LSNDKKEVLENIKAKINNKWEKVGFDTKTSDMSDCTALKPFQETVDASTDQNLVREASILEICVYPVIAEKEMHRLADVIREWAGMPNA